MFGEVKQKNLDGADYPVMSRQRSSHGHRSCHWQRSSHGHRSCQGKDQVMAIGHVIGKDKSWP